MSLLIFIWIFSWKTECRYSFSSEDLIVFDGRQTMMSRKTHALSGWLKMKYYHSMRIMAWLEHTVRDLISLGTFFLKLYFMRYSRRHFFSKLYFIYEKRKSLVSVRGSSIYFFHQSKLTTDGIQSRGIALYSAHEKLLFLLGLVSVSWAQRMIMELPVILG